MEDQLCAYRKTFFILEIRIFIQKAAADPSIINQFFKAGGKPLEIAQVLNKVDKNELFHIAYVFNGLHLILMEKMNQTAEQSKDAVETCAYILNNHRVCIEKLLASNYATHKRAVLKLLTDTVYLAPHLGRELLATFNVAFNSETLTKFTAHDRSECNLPNEEHVRTCYIYFILAFIIEGNHVLIKNLLDRNDLLVALLSGLVYDSKDVVLLVLNSFLKFVLQSNVVTKTKKVQVFELNVVNELVRLFEWKGPEYFAAITSKKTKDKASQCIDIEDFNIVSETVHQFLCELLASRKNGIAFMCLGQRNTKTNRLQKKLLASIDHFMNHAHKSKLVIEILKACPELMKKFVQKHAPCLDPFKKNNNWMEAIQFFTTLIDEMPPKIIRKQIDNVNVKELTELVKEICMPPEIMQQLRNKETLRSANLQIRYKATNLLHSMFKQCNQYLYSCTKWCPNRSNEMKKVKFEMINHITAHCPSVEHILLSLHMSQVDESADSVKMFQHLECILDLLLIITESVPAFIETTSSVINYIKILGPIYELNREQDSSTRIEFKAVKLMLALEPKALSPKTQLFNEVIQSFFNVYRFGSPKEQLQAKHLLRNVFHNTGLFENGPLEIDLWLTAMNQIDEDSAPAVRKFLVERIKSHDASESQLVQLQSLSNEQNENLIETFKRIERGETLKGILDVATLKPIFLNVVKALQEMEGEDEKEEIQEYVEMVAFYLFHYLPQPETVYHATECIPNKLSSYMKRWIVQSKAGKLPEDTTEILNKFYSSLIENFDKTFLEIFEGHSTPIDPENAEEAAENIVKVNFNGTEYILSTILSDETQIMVFIYMLLFVSNQMHKSQSLSAEKCNQIVRYFGDFMKILSAIATKTGEISQFGFEVNDSEVNPSVKALKYVFSNCYYLLHSFDIWSKDNQITRLVYEMVRSVEHSEHMNEILVHYRQKISNQIATGVEKTKETGSIVECCDNLLDLLTTFRLDIDNCSEIVTALSQLDYKYFITRQNDISIYAGILAQTLQRLAELKQRPIESGVIAKISSIYVDLVRKHEVEINYQIIEEALYAYLVVYYHHIADVNRDLFDAIFEAKRLNKASIKLACLLIERNSNLLDRLPKLIETNMTKKELIYPLINVVAVKNIELDGKLLSKLYADYKNGILKTIEKPNKAAVIYKENVLSSVFLIEKCMPIKDCTDFLRKSINYEGGEVYQIQIIKSIHLKVLMHSEDVEAIQQSYEGFLNTFIRLFNALMKPETLDYKKINAFVRIVFDWTKLKTKLLPEALSSRLAYQEICGSQLWLQLGKSCLKHGLKLKADKKVQDTEAAVLLKLFAYLCDEIYKNDSEAEDAKTFFEMTTSHPNFFDIITAQQQKSTLKTNLAYLMYVLVRKNSETMESSHIPILLGGYQARMSHCDQYLLALLQLYEKNGCSTYKYRPFLFGESALSHYSLTSSANIKPNLLQEPPMMQVMALIDADISENTLVNFPAWRQLNVIDQVPSVEFECFGIAGEEHSNSVSVSRSNIEKLAESGETKFNANVLSESARRDETFDNVYDPAFLIPIMQMAFAPESFTKPLRPAQNGLLAVTFACLSSCDKEMRLAAAAALQRYRNHMESARFVDNKLWLHLFDGIKNGIQNLTLEAQKRKKNRIPRIPYIAGIFFSRTINVLMNPLSELYRPLSTFLLIKNSFDFVTVPEFNVLFHSPDVNHSIHRNFILDVLRDGLKTNLDFNVLIANHIFKALFGYYGSPATTRERNIQILTVVNAAVKIPKSAKLMIDVVGLLPWLSWVIDNVEFFQFDFLYILCTILNNLHNSVIVNRDEYGLNGVNSIETQLMQLLFKICPNLSSRVAEVSFVRYLNVLRNILLKGQRSKFLSEENLKHLIKCTFGYVDGGLIWDSSFLMENPMAVRHCERKYEYNRRLREQGDVNEQTIFILSSLREVIISWQQNKHLLDASH